MSKRLKVKDTRSKRGQATAKKEEDQERHVKESDFFCEFCDYESDKRVKCKGFCEQCNTFLCKTCIDKHNNTPGLKGHLLLHGARMPRGLHDKPVKYSVCALHMENVCDCYCIHHRSLICRQCAKDYHDSCNTHFVPLLCRRLGPREVGEFTESIKNMISTIRTVRTALEENISQIEEQRNQMIQEANTFRDNLIEKINKALQVTTENINGFCKEKCGEITERMSKLSDSMKDYEATLADINGTENEDIVPSVFLKFQAIGKQKDLRTAKLIEHCKTEELSFLSEFENPQSGLSEELIKRLGTVKEKTHDVIESIDYSHVRFPVLSDLSESDSESNENERHITIIRAAKKTPVNVRAREDHKICDIRGMSVTVSGNILILDNGNGCVRIISPGSREQQSLTVESADNREQASLAIPAELVFVAVIDDKKAVVSTMQMKGSTLYDSDHIHILDISNENAITVLRSLKGYCRGICPYKNYLILATDYYPAGVKMIDYSDKELQSIAGARMIWPVGYVSSPYPHPSGIVQQYRGKRSAVVVNYNMNSIVIQNANDGAIINTARLGAISTHTSAYVSCLTTDVNGNVYGYVGPCNELRVWSPDLQESRTLLTEKDFGGDPMSMVYNDQTEELYVGYRNFDFIDRFQLIL